jgi:two-component system sensor histidine kinase KdpD
MEGPQLAHEPAEVAPLAPVAATAPSAAKDNLRSYLTAGGCILTSTVLCLFLRPIAALEDLAMVHLLGIVLLSMWCSVTLSLAAASLMVLTFDYVFVPPSFGFSETEFTYSLTFVVMILVAGVVSGLQKRFRREERAAREAAFHARTLYGLEKALSAGAQSQARMQSALSALEASFESRLELVLGRPKQLSQGHLTREQLALAERAFGRLELSRDTDAAAAGVWAPLVGESGCLGVLGRLGTPAGSKGRGADDLFEACASRLASAIESTQLGEAARKSELAAETERMRSSLLSAVSHDLKTPLSSILAAGTTLLERRAELDEQAFDELLSAVVLETERLSRLVHDLLSVTRLESNAIVLRKSAESIEEIVSVAVQRLRAQGVERVIRCDFGKELPLVLVDPTLIEQVVINLMTNAVRYAGPSSPIDLDAAALGNQVLVRVQDRGPGVLPGERSRVFDKFYRGASVASADGGIGLGLTICRAIVTAHGGTITLAEREGGGASVEFTLPALSLAREPLAAGSAAP